MNLNKSWMKLIKQTISWQLQFIQLKLSIIINQNKPLWKGIICSLNAKHMPPCLK